MGFLGAVLGKAIVLGSSGVVGFILDDPPGAGMAMAQASTLAASVGLAGVV
jgi:hypothetical protein